MSIKSQENVTYFCDGTKELGYCATLMYFQVFFSKQAELSQQA